MNRVGTEVTYVIHTIRTWFLGCSRRCFCRAFMLHAGICCPHMNQSVNRQAYVSTSERTASRVSGAFRRSFQRVSRENSTAVSALPSSNLWRKACYNGKSSMVAISPLSPCAHHETKRTMHTRSMSRTRSERSENGAQFPGDNGARNMADQKDRKLATHLRTYTCGRVRATPT